MGMALYLNLQKGDKLLFSSSYRRGYESLQLYLL